MKDVVYISSYLSSTKYGKPVADQLLDKLSLAGFEVKIIEVGVKNEWCRDFMPIKGADGKLVQFRYQPTYLSENDQRIPNIEEIRAQLDLQCETSNVILDGGAIEIYTDIGIVSDRVFRDNKKPERVVINEIKKKLDLK